MAALPSIGSHKVSIRGNASQLRQRINLHPNGRASTFRVALNAHKVKDQESVENKSARQWGKEAQKITPKVRNPGQAGWKVLDLAEYNKGWDIPWNWATVAGGMALWAGCFVGTSFVAVPRAFEAAGVDLRSLSPSGQTAFSLVCQIAVTLLTFMLVKVLTSAYADEVEGKQLFSVSLSDPVKPGQGWLVWALLGVVAAPALVICSSYALTALGLDEFFAGRGTVDGVVQMISLDFTSYINLALVTGVLAPMLEETVFRGFLLASLTKFMPTWAAVVSSSVAFGIAHLSIRDLPLLSVLGVVLGFSYVRSRNLLAPMIIHGTWNTTVLSILFYLSASGVSIKDLLHH